MATSTSTDPGCGAYGLRIVAPGLQPLPDLLPAPAGAAELRVSVGVHEQGTATPAPTYVTRQHAHQRLLGGGYLDVTREPLTATYVLPTLPSLDELVHPLLSPAAAVAQAWADCTVLHAGVIAAGAAAWLVLGDREDGKSTTLAWSALHQELDVLSDDVAVIRDGFVHAGPRAIDLRPASAVHLAGYWPTRLVRSGSRARLSLPACDWARPLGGVVRLAWGRSVRAVPLSGGPRLKQLAAQRVFPHLSSDVDLLDLAVLPMVELERPQHLESLPEACALLADLVR